MLHQPKQTKNHMYTPHLAPRDTRKVEISSVFVGFYIENYRDFFEFNITNDTN